MITTNQRRQAGLTEWFATRTEASIKDAAIAWACEQDDSIIRLMRLLNRTQMQNECLLWDGPQEGAGKRYGATGIVIKDADAKPGVMVKTHRLVFALTNGIEALPEGKRAVHTDDLVIDHICGNSMCLQPGHLRVITAGLNSSLQHQTRTAPPLSFGRVIATSGELVA